MSLPCLSAAASSIVIAVALIETTRLFASGSEAAALTMLVDRINDPVDTGIATDGLVVGIDEDHLVVLVGRVLVDPVRIQDTEVTTAAANTLLGRRLESTAILELVHTLVGGLACSGGERRSEVSGMMLPDPSIRGTRETNRRWHPWGRASCGLHGGHGLDR